MAESLLNWISNQGGIEHELEIIKNKSSSLSAKAREEGNKVINEKIHNKTIHLQILMLYSKSLAYAPIESEEFALALNNRSILLLNHLQKYEECMSDIDLALTVTKSDITMSKLLIRKIKCLKYLGNNIELRPIFDKANTIIENLPESEIKNKLKKNLENAFNDKFQNKSKLNVQKLYKLEHSDQLPYISDAIALNVDEKYGKHFIATRDIKSAEILIIEKSYCAYPILEYLYITCSHCLKSTFTSIPCHKCAYAVYCSLKCRKEAYEEYHDIECEIYPDLFENFLTGATKETLLIGLFTTRFFIKFLKDVGVEDMIKIANRIKIDKDYCNQYKLNLEDLLGKNNAFKIFYGLLTQEKIEFPVINETVLITLLKNSEYFEKNAFFQGHLEELKHIVTSLSDVSINNYFSVQYPNFQDEIYDSFRKVGSAINIACSIFNHSCIPNVDRMFLPGPKMVMYSIKPVKKDDQLFVTYGPTIQRNKIERTFRLKHYNFTCTCQACAENWPAGNMDYYKNVMEPAFISGKNREMDYYLRKINLPYHLNPMEEWGNNQKKNLEEIRKIIDFSYSKLKLFDACVINNQQYQEDLFKVLCRMYVDDFIIPNEC